MTQQCIRNLQMRSHLPGEVRSGLHVMSHSADHSSASPRRDRFLSSFDGVKLCDNCRSNQALVMSLLSSYLPPSEEVRITSDIYGCGTHWLAQDPEYKYRLDTYDEYKRTLEARYPPLCAACAILVEEEIRRKNSMARLNVLGRGLVNSKRTDRKRQVSASVDDRVQLNRELLWWKVRGVMFWCTLASAVAVDWIGMHSPSVPERAMLKHVYTGATSHLSHGYPACKRFYLFLLVLSPLWMAWDPTYAHMRRARLQGRRVNVHGRRTYIVRIYLEHFLFSADQYAVAAIVHVGQSIRALIPTGTTRIQIALGCFGTATNCTVSAEPLDLPRRAMR